MTSPRARDSGILTFVVFVIFALILFLRSGKGMMDDPGLGWHMAIADRIWKTGAFLYTDPFTIPSIGKPFVTYAWLGDFLMWVCEKWGGLNAVGALTALTFALTLQVMFRRMLASGVAWLAAYFWAWVAAFAILPMVLAIPNMYTYLGIVLTASICEDYHSGVLERRHTLWLLPLFLLWTNMHSGFLSGILVLVTTYATEAVVSVFASPADRAAARRRLAWWTVLGTGLALVTLLNPYGWHLHGYLAQTANDAFMRRGTTIGWLPPDFLMVGWGWAEAAILALPALLALSRYRPTAVQLALSIVFLHYALTGMRYTGLWAVIAIPTLARLADGLPVFDTLRAMLLPRTSPEFRAWLDTERRSSAWMPSLLFAFALLATMRWLPPVAGFNETPTAALDKVLQIAGGRPVFHDANWGGYLTWYGRTLDPPFETWIDDRIDVHGYDLLLEYRSILNAKYGWDDKLRQHGLNLVCVPTQAELTAYIQNDPGWMEIFSDSEAVVYERREPAS
jgi:hypothetical protein